MATHRGIPASMPSVSWAPPLRRRGASSAVAAVSGAGGPAAASPAGCAAGPSAPPGASTHRHQVCESARSSPAGSSVPPPRLHAGSHGRRVPPPPGKSGAAAAGQAPGGRRGSTNNPVVDFLKSIGLEQYSAAFLLEGVDKVETLLGLDDVDLRYLGVAPSHLVDLRGHLNELRHHSGCSETQLGVENPVVIFLTDVGLGQYAQVMISNGFDEMETLLEMEDEDMSALGLPRGHIMKLNRKLREFTDFQKVERDRLPAVAEHQVISQVTAPQKGSGQMPASEARSALSGHMKTAVEKSWEQVEILGPAVIGEMLYRHTFALAPQAIALFPPHVRAKYREWSSDEVEDESDVYNSPALRKLFSKIVNTVGCAVTGLHDPRTLVPMLLQLGSRHINYGTEEAHWEVVGQALQLTLRDALGSAYTKEVEAAWIMMYTFISQVIIEGLRAAIAQRDAELERRKAADLEPEVCSVGSTSIGRSSDFEDHMSRSSSMRAEEFSIAQD